MSFEILLHGIINTIDKIGSNEEIKTKKQTLAALKKALMILVKIPKIEHKGEHVIFEIKEEKERIGIRRKLDWKNVNPHYLWVHKTELEEFKEIVKNEMK